MLRGIYRIPCAQGPDPDRHHSYMRHMIMIAKDLKKMPLR